MQLDFSNAPVSAAVDVPDSGLATVLVLLAIAALAGLTALSAGLMLRVSSPGRWPRLASMPASGKVVLSGVFLALLVAQAAAAAGVFVHTRVVHGSAEEYFQYISLPRLIGTTHAHLFGYAVMYGLIGAILSFTEAKE